jgi:hypothetical protein
MRLFSCLAVLAALPLLAPAARAGDPPLSPAGEREEYGPLLDSPTPTLASLSKDVADLKAQLAELKALLKPAAVVATATPTYSSATASACGAQSGACATGSCSEGQPAGRFHLLGRWR